jgi:hypothetical protein
MKVSEVIRLLDAGFTRDEIAAMTEQELAPTPAQEPEQLQIPETTPTPAQPDQLQETMNQMKETLAAIQKANLMNAAQAGAAIQTSDDVWKSFFGNTNRKE